MKESPAKKRKLNSRIKDAKEDNHKIIQEEKKKKTKKETEKNDKKIDKKKRKTRNSKKNSNKKHKLKSAICNLYFYVNLICYIAQHFRKEAKKERRDVSIRIG